MRTDILDAQMRLAEINARHRLQLRQLGDVQGKKMVAYAKQNRPWTPHTHNAENTIGNTCEWLPSNKMRIGLTSGVDYGIYLEYVNFKHKGRLSIWWPTIKRFYSSIFEQWRKAVGRG